MTELLAMKQYEAALNIFEKTLGNVVTYSNDLDAVGKHVWGKKFKGVFSSDEKIPKGYSIVNTDKRSEPGTHWLAVCGDIIYDSFGRKIHKLSKDLAQFKNTELDAEQTAKEENCGARCLAFIFVYDTLGKDYAMRI
jgi:hypothetical protein